MSLLPGGSSWNEYMQNEGFRFYGYDEISILDLPDSEKAEIRQKIDQVTNQGEMWDLIHNVKSNLLLRKFIKEQ